MMEITRSDTEIVGHASLRGASKKRWMKLPNFGKIVGVDLIWVGGNLSSGRGIVVFSFGVMCKNIQSTFYLS
jgi:hypothetical protein